MRAVPHIAALSGALLGLVAGASALPAVGEDTWNPFKANSEQRPREPGASQPAPLLAPVPPQTMRGIAPVPTAQPTAPWISPRGGPVERSELAPVMAPVGSGLPLELWRGLDLSAVEELLAALDLPPRSPAVHQLWRRLLLASVAPPAGSPSEEHFVALRLEALYRSGLLSDMGTVLSQTGVSGPVVEMLRARRDIGLGRREIGCRGIAALAAPSSGLPGRLKGERQLLSGYCAAAGGDAQAAALAADLAREEGVEAELPLAVLTGVAGGSKPTLTLPARVLLLDYRFLELLGPVNVAQVFDRAEPALLAALAADTELGAPLKIAAAEAALGLNALAPELMASVYRQAVLTRAALDPAATTADPALRHALYFQAIQAARPGTQKARFLRAILEDARRRGVHLQMARVLAPLIADLAITPDTFWFAETALETELIAGRFDLARRWAEAANLKHWLALIDVADPERRGGRLASLAVIAQLAQGGRLGGEGLQRLATVLDALDIDVPIGVWDAANRAPQPAGGHLPETGVLADLAQASQRGDAARTILLFMRALGPAGPAGANILALGDGLRALRRVGLEADARQLALEALVAVWPRMAAN
ncbi:MAG: hypothetical protein J2P51_01535 [Hyphomicrobiaceae bacterium]|nr:hypothetical protein [Hyphomicrobiaceae bacterium]